MEEIICSWDEELAKNGGWEVTLGAGEPGSNVAGEDTLRGARASTTTLGMTASFPSLPRRYPALSYSVSGRFRYPRI